MGMRLLCMMMKSGRFRMKGRTSDGVGLILCFDEGFGFAGWIGRGCDTNLKREG